MTDAHSNTKTAVEPIQVLLLPDPLLELEEEDTLVDGYHFPQAEGDGLFGRDERFRRR